MLKKLERNKIGLNDYSTKINGFKKWAKALTFMRGMKQLRNAAFSATYKTLWCAGPSIENVKSIRSIKEIIDELKPGFQNV